MKRKGRMLWRMEKRKINSKIYKFEDEDYSTNDKNKAIA